MITLNQKNIGIVLVSLAILLIIILSVIKLDVDAQSSFLCKVVNDDPMLDMESCPAHQNNTSWIILIAFGISFLILGGGILMIFSQKIFPQKNENNQIGQNENIEESKEIDTSDFDEEEKKVFIMLKESNGSIYQSDIIKQTEFSKVKMTRILDKLEGRGLIDRKRRGMTNIVVLK
jgi:uncharacterized membrane protein